MDSPRKKRRRGVVKLTEDKLIGVLDSAISSQGSAELAVLHLFNCYDFDLDDLRRLLLGSCSFLKRIFIVKLILDDSDRKGTERQLFQSQIL
jgi:hypothetical protein